MPTATTNHATIWVCVDCHFTYHGVDDEPHPDAWSREPASTVTPGLVASEHLADCPNVDHDTGEWLGMGDCPGCEDIDFSWSRCEGCGSTLGGSRHAYTVWWDHEEGDQP
jgi:hypothetical protein